MNLGGDEIEKFTVNTPSGPIEANRSTEDPVEQKITTVEDSVVASFRSWAAKTDGFVRHYLGQNEAARLEACDRAFSEWQRRKDGKYSDQEVMSILGSYLGEKCVSDLSMEWVNVSDEFGDDYAVRYTKGEAMSFPHSCVLKRIENETHEFMYPVYYAIKQNIDEGDYKKRD